MAPFWLLTSQEGTGGCPKKTQGQRQLKRYHVRLTDEIAGNHVVILGCFDGRRDMQLLLERRMLR